MKTIMRSMIWFAVLCVMSMSYGAARAGGAEGTVVHSVRYSANDSYSRIVLDLSAHTRCVGKRLGNPDRVFLDITGSTLAKDAVGRIEGLGVLDGRIQGVRASQYDPETVRVVVDLKGRNDYNIFTLNDPPRMVIDVYGSETPVGTKAAPQAAPEPVSVEPRGGTVAPTPPLKTAKKVIVLDPGHGGKDPGAIGPGGIQEKDVVLRVAHELRDELERDGGYKVVLTRDDDRFLNLDERTVIANRHEADLFVSIHVNANESQKVRGIETYMLNFTDDKESQRVADRENLIHMRQEKEARSELDVILASLALQDKRDESMALAHFVQDSMIASLSPTYKRVKDLGVKQALFYVLVGAHMPAVLVEVSFITNPEEAARLKNPAYRGGLARGIAAGIREYFANSGPVRQMARR